jgi:hypothetical protein
MYVVKNKHLFTRNLEVHNHDTGSAKNIHLPITNLTIYKNVPVIQELESLIIYQIT